MKKLLLAISFLTLNGVMAIGQTTATDFTANDCSGTSHHLFAELDAGKIIVIAFVMPCGMCTGPSQNAYYTVQSYATSHPGKVLFYLADNSGSPVCSSLTSWGSSNSLSGVPTFADATVRETDYGSVAMPKIIALAGTDHKVIFSQDNALNTTNLKSAIDAAITPTSVSNVSNNQFQLSISPNPAKNNISVSYNINQSTDVNIEVYNLAGARVQTITASNQPAGHHDLNINLDGKISAGIYMLKLNAGGATETLKFTVTN